MHSTTCVRVSATGQLGGWCWARLDPGSLCCVHGSLSTCIAPAGSAAGKQPEALWGGQPGSSINNLWNFRLNSDVEWGSLGNGRAGALTRCSGFSWHIPVSRTAGPTKNISFNFIKLTWKVSGHLSVSVEKQYFKDKAPPRPSLCRLRLSAEAWQASLEFWDTLFAYFVVITYKNGAPLIRSFWAPLEWRGGLNQYCESD